MWSGLCHIFCNDLELMVKVHCDSLIVEEYLDAMQTPLVIPNLRPTLALVDDVDDGFGHGVSL